MDTNTEQLSIIAEGWSHKKMPTFDELSASILQTHQSAQASAILNGSLREIIKLVQRYTFILKPDYTFSK